METSFETFDNYFTSHTCLENCSEYSEKLKQDSLQTSDFFLVRKLQVQYGLFI